MERLPDSHTHGSLINNIIKNGHPVIIHRSKLLQNMRWIQTSVSTTDAFHTDIKIIVVTDGAVKMGIVNSKRKLTLITVGVNKRTTCLVGRLLHSVGINVGVIWTGEPLPDRPKALLTYLVVIGKG
jgi:hypothetical protein